MNMIVDAVLQDLAMDGDVGSQLPMALETAIRRYHTSNASALAGSDQVEQQNVDASYCQYIWKLLCQRQDIGIAVANPPASQQDPTSSSNNNNSISVEAEAGLQRSKKKHRRYISIRTKGDTSIPGADLLTPIQGDKWRSLPLQDLLSQFTHQDIRVVCSQECIRNAQAPARQNDITAPMSWVCLQLISRSRADGISGGDLTRQLGINGAGIFYLTKGLIELDLVSKFTARETRLNTTVVVHNKFKNECIYQENRMQVSRPEDTVPDPTARASTPSSLAQRREDDEDFDIDEDEQGQGQGSGSQPSSRRKGKAKANDRHPDSTSTAESTISAEVLEALALFDSEPEPRLVEQWLPIRHSNAPGNHLIKVRRRRPGPRPLENLGQSGNDGEQDPSLQNTDENGEGLASQNANDDDDDGSEVGDYEEVAQEERKRSRDQDQEEELAEAEAEAEAEAADEEGDPAFTTDATGNEAEDPDQSGYGEHRKRKVVFYTFSPLPRLTFGDVSMYRRDEIVYRTLKLLSLSPMGAMTKTNLRLRLGVPRNEDREVRRRYVREIYRLFNTQSFIEPVTYSYYARRKRSRPSSSILEGDSTDLQKLRTRATYQCWRLTERGKDKLREAEDRRKPLEAELRHQLKNISSSAMVHELSFERLQAEILDAAGAQGIVKNDLLDALHADRSFGRRYLRAMGLGTDNYGSATGDVNSKMLSDNSHALSESIPLIDNALVTLNDRAAGSRVDVIRLFTLRNLLIRSAKESTNLLAATLFTKKLTEADVNSQGGTVQGVGVGGWISLVGERRWVDPSQRWYECSLDRLGSRGTKRANEEVEESAEEGEDAPSTQKPRGRPKKVRPIEEPEPPKKRGRKPKDPSELKHPAASARRFAKLEAERKAKEAAEAGQAEAGPAEAGASSAAASNAVVVAGPAPKTARRGRLPKDPSKLKHPAASARRFAKLAAERKAKEEAEAGAAEAGESSATASNAAPDAAPVLESSGDQKPMALDGPVQHTLVAETQETQSAIPAPPLPPVPLSLQRPAEDSPDVEGTTPGIAQSASTSAMEIDPALLSMEHGTQHDVANVGDTGVPEEALPLTLGHSATPEPSPAPAGSSTLDRVPKSRPAKRVRIEVPTLRDADNQHGEGRSGSEVGDATSAQGAKGSGRAVPKPRRKVVPPKVSRLSLWDIRCEAVFVKFMHELGDGCIRDDRFRTLFSHWLVSNPDIDAAEMRPMAIYSGMRHDFIRRSEQVDMVYTSVTDPETKRPHQVGIIYLTSMSQEKLQQAIQSLQQQGDASQGVLQYPGSYGGSVASHDRRVFEGSQSKSAPGMSSRLPRTPWSKKVNLIDAPGMEVEDGPRPRTKRRRKKRTPKAIKRAELSAQQELRRQKRAAKLNRKQFWYDTWTRLSQAHEFTEHQRLWLESSLATAQYRFFEQLHSARHMNVEQLMRKRIQHALSAPEEELVIPERRPRARYSGMEGLTPSKKKRGRVPRASAGVLSQYLLDSEAALDLTADDVAEGGQRASTGEGGSGASNGKNAEGTSNGGVGNARRARTGTTRQFEQDELTRDVGVILTCRDQERNARANWSALRQLGIMNAMLFRKRWLHLKSFPAEDAYLRKLELTWMEMWRKHRNSESLPDPDPAHPTDFDLKQHLEFFRKNVDKNRVTSMSLPAEDKRLESTCPLEEWVDEVPQPPCPFVDLHVSETVCVQGNRLKSFLSWPFTLSQEKVVSNAPVEGEIGELKNGLAHTVIKLLLHCRDEADSVRIVPFLAEAVGREPVTAALDALLDRSIIRPAHSEGRLLPALNFEFSQEYLSALDGICPSIPGDDFVRRTREVVDDMSKGVPVSVHAGAEGEDLGALLQLISTGAIDLMPSISELQKAMEELPITEINAKFMVDADIGATVFATLPPESNPSKALSEIVAVDWDALNPAWTYWIDKNSHYITTNEQLFLRDGSPVLDAMVPIVRQAGAEGITKRALKARFAERWSEAIEAMLLSTAGQHPVLFWAGYDEARLVSCQYAHAWALPRPKVTSVEGPDNSSKKVVGDGFFVPRAWSNQLGLTDVDRRKACFNAILTECKYRPGIQLAEVMTLFKVVLSRLDVLDLVGLMDRSGLLELRYGDWRGQEALLRAETDRDVVLVPTNKLWWEEAQKD
ncbi:hypothetical protein CF319_g6616 [Tilletia indica]|nr:hypothetical protein CF319_g6616 [Tilletia indica]